MSPPIRFTTLLVALVLIGGCSTDDGASDEATSTAATATAEAVTTTAAPTTTKAATTTAAPTTTEQTSTTTTAAPVPEVDEETAAAWVAGVREKWDRTERTVGGTAPDLTDEEILAIGMSVCDYIAANPVPEGIQVGPRMEAYVQVAAVISEAMGIPYDPALEDAGFDSEIEGRNVAAFGYVIEEDGLCPEFSTFNFHLFSSPWSLRASAQDG